MNNIEKLEILNQVKGTGLANYKIKRKSITRWCCYKRMIIFRTNTGGPNSTMLYCKECRGSKTTIRYELGHPPEYSS